MRCLVIRALVALLVVSAATTAVRGQNELPQADAPQSDADVDAEPVPTTSVLDASKTDEIIDLLSASYAADLAMHIAIKTAECTAAEPRCAPLFFAQDVILGPWNFIKLLRVTQEQADQEPAVVEPRDYQAPDLPAAGVLPAEMVSLAQYAMEQQVALYEQLEAWQITLERLNAATARGDEPTATAQRRALDAYSSRVSTAAAGAGAASVQFLESLTPLMRHFASAISLEDEEAAKNDLRDNGFGPELQARLAAFRIGQADRDTLRDELFAVVGDAPVDLMEGLTAVARGYDRLADLTTVPTDAAGNLRPIANAGTDQVVPSGGDDRAAVTLTGNGSTDPEAGALQYAWTAGPQTVAGATPTITLPIGIHHVALTVSDGKGGTDVDLVTITVTNASAPVIAELTATPDILSPPNRQLIPVELKVHVTDNDDPEPFCQVVSVGVNEGGADRGAPASEPDVVLDGTLKVLLRAEHSGGKSNRVYTVTVQCTDKTNHSSLESVFVSVPR